jgi:hypothetical protein
MRPIDTVGKHKPIVLIQHRSTDEHAYANAYAKMRHISATYCLTLQKKGFLLRLHRTVFEPFFFCLDSGSQSGACGQLQVRSCGLLEHRFWCRKVKIPQNQVNHFWTEIRVCFYSKCINSISSDIAPSSKKSSIYACALCRCGKAAGSITWPKS